MSLLTIDNHIANQGIMKWFLMIVVIILSALLLMTMCSPFITNNLHLSEWIIKSVAILRLLTLAESDFNSVLMPCEVIEEINSWCNIFYLFIQLVFAMFGRSHKKQYGRVAMETKVYIVPAFFKRKMAYFEIIGVCFAAAAPLVGLLFHL